MVELKLLHNLKSEATWAYNNIISRLIRYRKLSCIEFYSCNLQQSFSIDLLSYWIPDRGQKGPMNKVCPSLCQEVILKLAP